jgi:hypothetical protein
VRRSLTSQLVCLTKEMRGYLGFLNSIVPSGVVNWYVKSSVRSCLARSLSVVPSTIHSPFVPASRCRYFWVVSSFLWPISCLTISAFCVQRRCLVAYACLRS